jgi:hypothetical protein
MFQQETARIRPSLFQFFSFQQIFFLTCVIIFYSVWSKLRSPRGYHITLIPLHIFIKLHVSLLFRPACVWQNTIATVSVSTASGYAMNDLNSNLNRGRNFSSPSLSGQLGVQIHLPLRTRNFPSEG